MNSEPKEVDVAMNGIKLNFAESMTLRVAVTNFIQTLESEGLEEDEQGKRMTKAYKEHCYNILRMMLDKP